MRPSPPLLKPTTRSVFIKNHGAERRRESFRGKESESSTIEDCLIDGQLGSPLKMVARSSIEDPSMIEGCPDDGSDKKLLDVKNKGLGVRDSRSSIVEGLIIEEAFDEASTVEGLVKEIHLEDPSMVEGCGKEGCRVGTGFGMASPVEYSWAGMLLARNSSSLPDRGDWLGIWLSRSTRLSARKSPRGLGVDHSTIEGYLDEARSWVLACENDESLDKEDLQASIAEGLRVELEFRQPSIVEESWIWPGNTYPSIIEGFIPSMAIYYPSTIEGCLIFNFFKLCEHCFECVLGDSNGYRSHSQWKVCSRISASFGVRSLLSYEHGTHAIHKPNELSRDFSAGEVSAYQFVKVPAWPVEARGVCRLVMGTKGSREIGRSAVSRS